MSYDRFRNQREAYEETCRLIDNEFKRLNLDDWGDPKQPQGMSPQEIVAERNRQQAEKWNNANPLWEGLKSMDLGDWLDVGGQALQGAERVASGATFGAYDWLNRTLGGNYAERKQRLQEAADSAGIGLLNELTGAGLELAGNVAGGGGLLGKGLIKTGLRGSKLAAVGGGIDGMLNAGFATENLADLPQNLLIGGISGALGGYGMDKTLRKGMTALGPFLAKHSKSFNEIANMKNGVTGEKGLNKSMRMARKMQSEGNIPTRYPANMQEARDNAIAASKKKYDSLASAGDLEILDITNKLENLPSASMTPLKYDTLPQYQTRLRQEAQKSGMGLYGDINHFTKDGRKKMVHTLNRTLKAPDISMLKKEPEGFRLYTMRKYQADGQKPMYDLLMQRNEQEIFNKFATDKPRYVAEQFTGPALSLKSTKSPKNDLGVIMFPNNNIYLSKIGGLARESSPIQDAIKNVRAQNSAFVNLPDTDFKVLEAAGRHLDDGVRLNRFPAGGAEDNNVRQLYKLMDELQPEFPSYRDTLDVRYNREVAKNLANRPLQIYDRINNISNGRLDVSLPVGVSGDLSKYWVK